MKVVKQTISAAGFQWQDISKGLKGDQLDFWSDVDGMEIHANCEYWINHKVDPAEIELNGFVLSATIEGEDNKIEIDKDLKYDLAVISIAGIENDGILENEITELQQDAYIAY